MKRLFPRHGWRPALFLLCLVAASRAAGADVLVQTVDAVKPSIVGIGSFKKTRSPAVIFVGTGFVVGDGLTVLTAAHVLAGLSDSEHKESLGILVGMGENMQFRGAVLVAVDEEHDLARLRIAGAALPALQLGDSSKVGEGQTLAFTGFPLGMALGLHPVTHRGMVSSITPITIPSLNSKGLDLKSVKRLQKPLYSVFQLDATAYPGSSGSPLYDPATGQVLGVINMVYVKGVKETALSHPSGITYAIPGNFIRDLMRPN